MENSPIKLSRSQELHVARSKLLDAYILAEEAVSELLERLSQPVKADLFGQRIELLRNVKAGPAYSKANREAVRELLDNLEDRLSVRNDIAHGKLRIATIDRVSYATFRNARQIIEPLAPVRLATAEQLIQLEHEVHQIARQLAAVLLNPASSPPPPSPGAAGGP